jgi:transposase
MLHVGLDIHSTRITICALNETGQVVRRSQVRGIEEMLAIPQGLPDRFEVCYEASCGYGHYHDLLRPLAARVLDRQARKTPAVALLRTIPGVGARTAEAIAAFVDDPHRFRNAKAVGRYFGLVPCQDQSGDRNRLGHITREGAPVVRQLLAEAARQAIRRSPTARAFYERTRREDPQRQKIAVAATAHYLVRVMWAMLRRGTVWRESPALTA